MSKKKQTVLKDLKDIPPVTPPKSKPSKEKRPVFENHMIRHDFTPEERLDLGDELARVQNEYSLVEGEKKQAMDGFKSRLSSLESRAGEVGSKMRSGWEYRTTRVEVKFFPKENLKRFYLPGKTKKAPVGQEPMTEQDHQLSLEIPPVPKETPAPPKENSETPAED